MTHTYIRAGHLSFLSIETIDILQNLVGALKLDSFA